MQQSATIYYNRYGLQNFILKYNIKDMFQLNQMRKMALDNVIFDVLENDETNFRKLKKTRWYPAQEKQFSIIKAKYVKIKSRTRLPVHLATLHL